MRSVIIDWHLVLFFLLRFCIVGVEWPLIYSNIASFLLVKYDICLWELVTTSLIDSQWLEFNFSRLWSYIWFCVDGPRVFVELDLVCLSLLSYGSRYPWSVVVIYTWCHLCIIHRRVPLLRSLSYCSIVPVISSIMSCKFIWSHLQVTTLLLLLWIHIWDDRLLSSDSILMRLVLSSWT